jgi:bacterioferritin
MKKKDVIALLNKDLADEHAAIIRYLVHGWLEGEDTPMGASLLSRSREEMWHMHWLGMIIGQLGGEPDLKPAPYPYDPTNRATIFRSYIEYEESLVPHYRGDAEMVDDAHIRRVLEREAWESAVHAKKFQRILEKLEPEEAAGVPGGELGLSDELLSLLQKEVTVKYGEMLQHIRSSWVFQKSGDLSWNLMDQAMEKMKHLAHFAEDIGGNGIAPQFRPSKIDMDESLSSAVGKAIESLGRAQKRHLKLRKDPELNKHAGMLINLDLTSRQEQYQKEELEDAMKSVQQKHKKRGRSV